MGLDDTLQVSVDVTNAGPRAGQEVVQLYLRDPECSLSRPPRELKGFRKVSLAPGETQTVTFALTIRDLAFYDPARSGWVAEAGEFVALLGSSSRDIRAHVAFALQVPGGGAVRVEPGPRTILPRLTADSPLAAILADRRGKALLQKHLGPLMQSPRLRWMSGYTLRQLAGISAGVSPQAVEAIGRELAQLT